MAEERGGREEGGERILVVDGFDQSINDDIVSRWYRDATHDGRTQVNVTGVNFEVTPECVCVKEILFPPSRWLNYACSGFLDLNSSNWKSIRRLVIWKFDVFPEKNFFQKNR